MSTAWLAALGLVYAGILLGLHRRKLGKQFLLADGWKALRVVDEAAALEGDPQDPRLRLWLEEARQHPQEVLQRLESERSLSPGGVYLRAHLELCCPAGLAGRAWLALKIKGQMNRLLEKHPKQPQWYWVRAHASAWLGNQRAAIDDLARALYFSEGRKLYAQAVMQLSFLRQERPALVQQAASLLEMEWPQPRLSAP